MDTKYFVLILLPFYCPKTMGQEVAVNVNQIGRSLTELQVREHSKSDAAAILFGNSKKSKALAALRRRDIAAFVRKEINNLRPPQSDPVRNQEFFIVARVNNEIITNVDILNEIRYIFFSSNQKFDIQSAKLMLEPVLSSLIEDKLRINFAKLNKLPIDDSAVDFRIDEIAKNNNMTVKQLEKEFVKAGINMTIFKKNLRAKMIFAMFFQSILAKLKPTKEALISEKQRMSEDIKQCRYKLREIFLPVRKSVDMKGVKDKMQNIKALLDKGFSFEVLSDVVSQPTQEAKINELSWVAESSLDQTTKAAVQGLRIGNYSEILEYPIGYKIIYLLDKANPHKAGASQIKYKVLKTQLSAPKTQEDAMQLNKKVEFLQEANSKEQFIKVCKVYNLPVSEREIENPDEYEKFLIEKSKTEKTAVLLQKQDGGPLEVLLVLSEDIPWAIMPSDEELSQGIIYRKAVDDSSTMMKHIGAMQTLKISQENLAKVLQ